MPAFITPAGYLPEGLPERTPPASLVYARTAEGVVDVFAMRPRADAPNAEAVTSPQHRELEIVAGFSMETDEFIDIFGGILDDRDAP